MYQKSANIFAWSDSFLYSFILKLDLVSKPCQYFWLGLKAFNKRFSYNLIKYLNSANIFGWV
jgi:hypothetical protein